MPFSLFKAARVTNAGTNPKSVLKVFSKYLLAVMISPLDLYAIPAKKYASV